MSGTSRRTPSTTIISPSQRAPFRGRHVWGGCLIAWLIACDGATTPTTLSPTPQAPEAVTVKVSRGNGAGTATLHGVVTPRGSATETWFEWGTSPESLVRQTAIRTLSETSAQEVSATIDSLEPATTYYFRAVARNEVGRREGETLRFITLSSLPRLAFVRAGDIYVYDSMNESTIQLTSGGTFGHPAWSPDGNRIAFAEENTWPASDRILLINADGSGLTVLGEGRSPTWSPDGRRLAFATLFDGQGAILVRSVDDPGPSAVRIGFDRGYHDFPAWSPDGTRIAFVSDWMGFDFAYDIYIANADGTGEIKQVTNGFLGNQANWPTYTIYSQPSWSPDGRSLAVMECVEWQWASCTISRVGVMGADGGGVRPLTNGGFRLLTNTAGFARPGWAPDGSAVVFSPTCWDHKCPSAIRQVTLHGARESLLIEDAHSGVWSP